MKRACDEMKKELGIPEKPAKPEKKKLIKTEVKAEVKTEVEDEKWPCRWMRKGPPENFWGLNELV